VIKRTINRPENRDKIVDFAAILMTWVVHYTLVTSLIAVQDIFVGLFFIIHSMCIWYIHMDSCFSLIYVGLFLSLYPICRNVRVYILYLFVLFSFILSFPVVVMPCCVTINWNSHKQRTLTIILNFFSYENVHIRK
jgi:hypothetical protein